MKLTDSRPAFLVTIDTEGDNQWGRSNVIETKDYQPPGGAFPVQRNLCGHPGRAGLPGRWLGDAGRIVEDLSRRPEAIRRDRLHTVSEPDVFFGPAGHQQAGDVAAAGNSR